MATIPQPSLFTWKEIENLSDIHRLKTVLESMPDEDLMQKRELQRGQGRDDYPIRAVWNSLLAGVVFQHSTVESLRRELGRNVQLCWVCGFDLGRGDKMAHGGFEKYRNTIKYRCPARHYGCTCYGKGQCEIKTAVRIPINEDRRVFGPVARDSCKWNDIYKKRTAVEGYTADWIRASVLRTTP